MMKVPNDQRAVEDIKKEMASLVNVAGQENIMRFEGIYVNSEGSQCFLVERCGLGSLDKLHHKFDLLDDSKFWPISKGLLSALVHLHRNGILHRDVACNAEARRTIERRVHPALQAEVIPVGPLPFHRAIERL